MEILLLLAIVISTVVSALMMPRIVKFAYDKRFLDLPSNRKVHSTPVPRLGGLCFFPISVGVFALIALLPFRSEQLFYITLESADVQHILAYVFGGIILYIIGIIDDIVGMSYKIKFVAQTVSALSLCLGGVWIANMGNILFINEIPFWIGVPLSVLFIVYVTNAVNLIDGIDGLASGLSCVSLVVIIAMSAYVGNFACALLASAFLGAVSGFFYFNVFAKRFKLFMGDTGSLTLGYALSFFILHFWQNSPVLENIPNSGIIAVSTLVIPLFDVVRVFASRMRDGRNPFLPDKNHIHHKIIRMGIEPHCAMALILLISACFVAVNYLMAEVCDFTAENQTLIVIIDVVLYTVMQYVINHFISLKEHSTGEKWSREL